MKIKNVEIRKFRNLSNLSVHLSPDINYIVGENNIGKSNFIDFLRSVGNPYDMIIEDSYTYKRPIDVTVTILLENGEADELAGKYKIEEDNLLKIRVFREFNSDAVFVRDREDIDINPDILQRVNFWKYDTIGNDLHCHVGNSMSCGQSFHSSLSLYVSELSKSDPEKASLVLRFFSEYLLQKEAFRKLKIKTRSFDDGSLFSFTDKSMNPSGEGYDGLQFIAEALFDIVIRIFNLYKSKGPHFSDYITTDSEGRKLVQFILAVDEPEVHLHPYLQRALINYYKKIFSNKDEDFNILLKKCFGIDGINGQLIIITHSTDALMDDHRNLIRFYRNVKEAPSAVSGIDLKLQWDVEKHLIMHFPEIKEAFYSKCTLIVEGESEYGCLGLFAETLENPLDDFGIDLVNARGEGTIPKLVKLFNYFNIPSVVIFDNDVKRPRKSHKNEFYTEGICFEWDVVEALIKCRRFDILKKIALEVDPYAYGYELEYYFVRKPLSKIGYELSKYRPDYLGNIEPADPKYKILHYAWMYKKKGVMMGRVIGAETPRECIPKVYKKAIYRAVEVALS